MRSTIGWLSKVGNSNSAWFYRVRSVMLVLCAAILPANVVEARVWTFVDGTTADARYVRSRDGYVWLQAGRKREKFSLDQIEAGDQMWVRMRELKQVDRTWTKSWGGTKYVGRFLRFRDGEVHIESDSETVEIEFAALIPKDQTLVRAILATHGKEDRVPSAFAAEDSKSESDPADWQAIDSVRIWTNVAGQQRRGKLERVDKDSRGNKLVILFEKKENQETQLYFHELSDADQQYVIAKTSNASNGSGTRNSSGLSSYNPHLNNSPNQLNPRGGGQDSFSKVNGLNVPEYPLKRDQHLGTQPNARDYGADREQKELDSRTWNFSDAPHPALQPKSGTLSPASPLTPAAPSLEDRRSGLPVVQPDGSTLFPRNLLPGMKGKPQFVDREPLVTTPRQDAPVTTVRQTPATPSNNSTNAPLEKPAPEAPTPESVVVCGNCGQQFTSQQFSVGSTCPHCGRTVHQLQFADGHVERSLGFWKPFLLGGSILIAFLSAWAYVRLH